MRLTVRRIVFGFACALAAASVQAATASAAAGAGSAPNAFAGQQTPQLGVVTQANVSTAATAALGDYRFTAIAFPGHQAATWPWNVNAWGVVLGEYWTGAPNDAQDGSQALGFMDYRGHYVTVKEPDMGPYDEMNAYEVTQSGDVIGGYYSGDTASTAGSNGRIYIDHNGHFTNLNDPNATTNCASGQCGTWPLSANLYGEVVGAYVGTDGVWHGFIYRDDHWTTVDCPLGAGYGANLYYVSDQGLISGSCYWDDGWRGVASNFFYTEQGQFVTFPDLTSTQAPGILPNTRAAWGDSTDLVAHNDYSVRDGNYWAAPTTQTCAANTGGVTFYGWVQHNDQVLPITVPSTTIPLPDISNPNTCAVEMWGDNEAGQVVGQYWGDTSSQYGKSYGFLMTPRS